MNLSEPLNVEKSIREYMEQTDDKMAKDILEILPKLLGSEAT